MMVPTRAAPMMTVSKTFHNLVKKCLEPNVKSLRNISNEKTKRKKYSALSWASSSVTRPMTKALATIRMSKTTRNARCYIKE